MKQLFSLLGLVRKAGLASFGHDSAKAALRSGQAKLCLLCADASPRLKEEFRFLARETNTPLREIEATSLEIKAATQYKAAVVTVNNAGFAEKILAS
ncbi:MAG: ribosomal L7Ae/L30e/S12e/Gadd45 family protein [Oscillospiraceae bacterium]|jgi:large subunit ribosomal protein L30e|nr:ribosomal L7Ae/L30e/S12e/Gadd45 family protein [Oscillospiraceae bacterium]